MGDVCRLVGQDLSQMMRRVRAPAVYMMANRRRGTIYTGAASDLPRRAWQHRNGVAEGFTKRYNCKLLVWYERGDTMDSVFSRERQIKGGSRTKKIELIEAQNPAWLDLYDDIASA